MVVVLIMTMMQSVQNVVVGIHMVVHTLLHCRAAHKHLSCFDLIRSKKNREGLCPFDYFGVFVF